MQKETELVITTSSGREKYDEVCKQTWKLKEVIAPVLQCAIKEYHDYPIADIIGFINADTISDQTPVDDLPAFIEGKETEFSSITEKRVFFDIHFTAKNPKLSSEDINVMLHIDFEVQNDYVPTNPSYPITKRAIYYAARELSSQLNVVTTDTNYNRLEKVYSIWICNENIPRELRDSITRYYLKKDDIIGICTESEEYHDLMEVIMIRRGGEAVEDTIFEYLQGIFTSNLATIRKYVDIENNKDVREALKTMCGLGESLENRGIEKGIEKGIAIEFLNSVNKLLARMTLDEALGLLEKTLDDYEKAQMLVK